MKITFLRNILIALNYVYNNIVHKSNIKYNIQSQHTFEQLLLS